MEKETLKKPSLLGMFRSPSEQFERIRERPLIWGALAIVTVIYTIASIISARSLTAEDIMGPGMTAEDAEMFLGFTRTSTAISGVIGPIISILISTVIYLIIVKIARKNTTFRQLFSMNTYIMVIGAVGLLLNNMIQSITGGPQGIYITSLAGLFNSDSLVLATFEVFSIWQLILTAIGLHKVGGLSKGLAWALAIVFFVISLGIALIGTALEGLIGL